MKLSIVTINLNNVTGLIKTIDSVLNQNFNNFEFIIIDGASTDGSIDIIKQNQDKLSFWVSEKDSGIFNAMNKGLIHANGDRVLFLNSGDYLLNEDSLNKIYAQHLTADIVICDAMRLNNRGKIEKYIQPNKVDAQFFYKYSLCHQSIFYKRDLFNKLGKYNENFKIVSDWEFNLKALIFNNCTYQHINIPLVYFDVNGQSSINLEKMNIERLKVLSSVFTRQELKNLEKQHIKNNLIYRRIIKKINKFLKL